MNGPYGFEPNRNCLSCTLHRAGHFCQLVPQALQELNGMRSTATYPAGAVLFVEKQDPRGLFVLCGGQVKLSISSSAGKTLILRIAQPGEVLGLLAVLSGSPYEVTAETLHPCQVAFVSRADFLRLMAKHPGIMDGALKQLSQLYNGACEQLRTVGLSSSAPEKVARILLDWCATGKKTKEGTQMTISLTHEEIAESIGTTRETVTRTLSDFKAKNLVSIQGSTLTVPSQTALELIADA